MTRLTAFLWSLNILVGSTLALAAEGPTPDLGLPVPRAGESVGQAKMLLNGKPFTFNQVVAYQTLKYGQPTLAVLFSDQPINVDELKATLVKGNGDDSDFADFKPHLQLYISAEGKPQSCSFWKDNFSVSASGAEWQGALAVKDGRARGKVTLEIGDEPANRKTFDVRVDAPIVSAALPAAKTAEASKPANPSGPAAATGKNPLAAKSLPLPADASDVEYKEIVGAIAYKSRSDVATLAAFLAKSLAAQGWKSDDDDLVTPASAILARKLGDAELTIFIKPAAGGSTVNMMTEGLKW